jgi:hypothetical protein
VIASPLAVVVLPLLLAGAPAAEGASPEEAGARQVAQELRAAIEKGDATALAARIPPQGLVFTETAVSRADALKDLEPGGFLHAIYLDTGTLRRLERDPSERLSYRDWFARHPAAEVKATRLGRGQYRVWFDDGKHEPLPPHFDLEVDSGGRWWLVRHPAAP